MEALDPTGVAFTNQGADYNGKSEESFARMGEYLIFLKW